MKKSDFKTFDIIFLRNNKRYFYFRNLLIPINNNDPELSLDFYNDNLTRKELYEKDYDIMRIIRWDDPYNVWSLSDIIAKVSEDFAKFETIFERGEILELTIDDIAEKYNVSPNQIRIKK